jgi:3-hydroxymyristoyl/3-hydroxydecanoyl-(acyl carrier protein) dehydratase
MNNSHESLLEVPADHPSLPGHFPGNAIIPGVVLLDEVVNAAERWLSRAVRVRALPQVKFVQPLKPQESAQINLALDGSSLKFTIHKADAIVAQGVMQLAEGA